MRTVQIVYSIMTRIEEALIRHRVLITVHVQGHSHACSARHFWTEKNRYVSFASVTARANDGQRFLDKFLHVLHFLRLRRGHARHRLDNWTLYHQEFVHIMCAHLWRSAGTWSSDIQSFKRHTTLHFKLLFSHLELRGFGFSSSIWISRQNLQGGSLV